MASHCLVMPPCTNAAQYTKSLSKSLVPLKCTVHSMLVEPHEEPQASEAKRGNAAVVVALVRGLTLISAAVGGSEVDA